MKAMAQRVVLGQAILLAICLVLAGLIGRLAYINVRLAPGLTEYSYRRQTSTVTIPGRRGYVLDRRFRLLAGSEDRYILYADPRAITDKPTAAAAIARVLGRPTADVLKKLEDPTSPGYVVLLEDLDRPQREGIEGLAMDGLGVQREPGRTYPMGSLAATTSSATWARTAVGSKASRRPWTGSSRPNPVGGWSIATCSGGRSSRRRTRTRHRLTASTWC